MIDWSFISSLEGHRLSGYVPDAEGSNSGVTVADGVDLGQLSKNAFAALPGDVKALIEPYVGLKKQDAANALAANKLAGRALVLTEAQADALNEAVRGPLMRVLKAHYDQDASHAIFEHLADAAQTVLASVAFQYGSPWTRCPKFWASARAGDWPGVVHELENFGDAYPTRRHAEAAYLRKHLGL